MLNLPNNWLIVAVVLLSGGGNYLTTKGGFDQTAREVEVSKAIREIHDLHGSLDAFEDRQRKILDALKALPSPTPH